MKILVYFQRFFRIPKTDDTKSKPCNQKFTSTSSLSPSSNNQPHCSSTQLIDLPLLKKSLIHQFINFAFWIEYPLTIIEPYIGLFLRKNQKQHVFFNSFYSNILIYIFDEKIENFSQLRYSYSPLEFFERRLLFRYPFRDWNAFPFFVDDVDVVNLGNKAYHLVIVLKQKKDLLCAWALCRSPAFENVPVELKIYISEFYDSKFSRLQKLLNVNILGRWIYVVIPLIRNIRVELTEKTKYNYCS